MAPVIGITSFHEDMRGGTYVCLNENYTWSVRAAGGVPLPIPLPQPGDDEDPDTWVGILDGLLLSGGSDIAPTRYGEDPLRQVETFSSARDEWELALFAAARKRGLPILGICRGHQLINVALGGTLYQDIPSQRPSASGHYPAGLPMHEPYHEVAIEQGSKLRAALVLAERSEGLSVNSFHHQSVKDLAPGLKVTARSRDAIIEGFEAEGEGFLMGVQFHPEAMTRRHPRFLGIFRAFVEASEKP